MTDEIKTPEIKLELTGVEPTPVETEAAIDTELPPERIEQMLSAEELAAVDTFSAKIDVTDTNLVLNYGAAAQTKLSTFSESALENVRTKDMGAVGESLSSLIGQLSEFDFNPPKGFLGLFRKAGSQISALKARYTKAEVNVDKVCTVLEDHQTQLMKDIAVLDELYAQNLTNYKELGMYILAGHRKLTELREVTLPGLQKKAEETGVAEDAQAAKDMVNYIDRFEKKIHDLELTRMVSIQMAPQIRLVQNSDALMTEKIQSTLVNTIPLWKSQMVLSLGIAHSTEAMEAQRAVTDMTNELLRKNAETLKTATVTAARESQRGVVDIETLSATNAMLISTLDEVMTIQTEGREKRQAAEAELGRIEGELKQALLEIRS